MRRLNWKRTASYVTLLAGAYLVALLFSWFFGSASTTTPTTRCSTPTAPRPWQPEVVLLAIDEPTLGITAASRRFAPRWPGYCGSSPRPNPRCAVDVILADRGEPARRDADLSVALRSTPNLVLSSELIERGPIWEDPRPEFIGCAQLAHVPAQPDKDGVTRSILVERRAGRTRRWALALEAFRIAAARRSWRYRRRRRPEPENTPSWQHGDSDPVKREQPRRGPHSGSCACDFFRRA